MKKGELPKEQQFKNSLIVRSSKGTVKKNSRGVNDFEKED